MDIIMPTGEKEEKTGTIMMNVRTAKPNRMTETDKKLDQIYRTEETGMKKDEHTDFDEN